MAVQKVVALASRQTNQKQVHHFVCSARHFPGCAGVRFSRGQEPQTYSSSAKRIFASAAEWRPGVPAEIPVPASADSGSRLVAMDDASSLSGVADFGVRFQW